MLKRIPFAAAALAIAVPCLAQTSAPPEMSPRGEAKATVAGKSISIDYGRPSLRGRDMLAQAKVGDAWRMGAGQPTTLKTAADLTFGAALVPKGEYVLKATKVDDQQWMLNVLDTKGSKVVDVPMTTEKLPNSVEQFTIEITTKDAGGDLKLRWGTLALRAPFTAR